MTWYGPVQIFVTLFSYYYFGFLYGTLAIFAFFKLAAFILYRVWSIEIATVGDFLFKYYEDQACQNFVVYMIVDRFDFETFKHKVLYEQCIKNLPRLWSYIKFFAGFMLWIPKSPEEGLKRIRRVDREIKSKDELLDFCKETLIKPMPEDDI